MTKFKVGDKVKASAYYLGTPPVNDDDYFEGFVEELPRGHGLLSDCYIVNIPSEEYPSGFPLLEEELDFLEEPYQGVYVISADWEDFNYSVRPTTKHYSCGLDICYHEGNELHSYISVADCSVRELAEVLLKIADENGL